MRTPRTFLEELEKEKSIKEATNFINQKFGKDGNPDNYEYIKYEDCAELMVEYSNFWIEVEDIPGSVKWEENHQTRWISLDEFLAIIDGEYHIVIVDLDNRSKEDIIKDINTGEIFLASEISSWKKI